MPETLDVEALVRRVVGRLQAEGLPAPDALVEDVVRMLLAHRGQAVSARDVPNYDIMLRTVSHGSRWRLLAAWADAAKRRTRARHGSQARQRELGNFVEAAARTIVYRLMHLAVSQPGGDPEALLQAVGDAFVANRESADAVVDSFVLVGSEIAKRARNVGGLDQWVDRELVEVCLLPEWSEAVHEPRPLRLVWLLGSQEQKLAGEMASVRGIAVKTREDQLKDVLPAEWALAVVPDALLPHPGQGDGARAAGRARIMDEHPLIYQHFETRRPMVRNRILLLMTIGAEALPERRTSTSGHRRARELAFRLLTSLALRLPPDERALRVDVAVFERREGGWLGGTFDIRKLADLVRPADNAVNVLALDRLLPCFFVRWADGEAESTRHEREGLRESPEQYLSRTLARRDYDSVVAAAIMRREERGACLPSGLAARRPRTGMNTVLMASVMDDQKGLRGDVYRDYMSAMVAGMPLPRVTPESLIDELVGMVVGPPKNNRRHAESRTRAGMS